jgi:hypothetical protein
MNFRWRAKKLPCVDGMLAQGWLIDYSLRGKTRYKDEFLQ